jgi:ABC-type uncharacterized transport system fused permease/ATPase subunit
MDISSIGCFGYHLCMAALTPEVFLHQAKVDLKSIVECGVGDPTFEGWLVKSRDAMEALDDRTLLKISHNEFRFLRQYFQNFFIHRTVSLKISKFNASISPIRRLLALVQKAILS